MWKFEFFKAAWRFLRRKTLEVEQLENRKKIYFSSSSSAQSSRGKRNRKKAKDYTTMIVSKRGFAMFRKLRKDSRLKTLQLLFLLLHHSSFWIYHWFFFVPFTDVHPTKWIFHRSMHQLIPDQIYRRCIWRTLTASCPSIRCTQWDIKQVA